MTIKSKELRGELADFEAYDISRYRELQKKEAGLKQEINDITDNVFTIKKWMLKTYPQYTDGEIDKMFEIPDDFDNV